MTKHSHQHKEVVSAHERKLMGFGTQRVRTGGESLGDFDQCKLCLHQVETPLVCPQGNLYCKGCIYEYLLAQKMVYKKALEEYEKQEADTVAEGQNSEVEKSAQKVEDFAKQEESIRSTGVEARARIESRKRKLDQQSKLGEAGAKKMSVGFQAYETSQGRVFIVDKDEVHHAFADKLTEEEREKRKQMLPCHWIPSLTPELRVRRKVKPDKTTKCPFGFPLKTKKLTAITFTKQTEDKTIKAQKRVAFMCPVSRKRLTNTSKLYIIKPTGSVVSQEVVALILSDGTYEGKKVKKSDVIKLNAGGTGFAAGGAMMAESDKSKYPKPSGIFWRAGGQLARHTG